MAVRQRCRNCSKECCAKNRGLCWSCYYDPGIRYLYDTFSTKKDGDGDFNGGYKLASEPTCHPPGSEGKIQIFEQRYKNKVSLFNPYDNNGDPENDELHCRRVS